MVLLLRRLYALRAEKGWLGGLWSWWGRPAPGRPPSSHIFWNTRRGGSYETAGLTPEVGLSGGCWWRLCILLGGCLGRICGRSPSPPMWCGGCPAAARRRRPYVWKCEGAIAKRI